MKPVRPDYLGGYPASLVDQARALHAEGRLEALVLARNEGPNPAPDNARLYAYTQELKRTWMRSSRPLGKVRYCDKVATLHRALGIQAQIVRVHGAKLKRSDEIRVSSIFKELPGPFLRMVVVHELAHLRHSDHDKAFYRLCCHMEPDYHRIELDLRLLLWARSQA